MHTKKRNKSQQSILSLPIGDKRAWNKKDKFAAAIGTGFGVGLIPFAPGTMGALLALLLWMVVAVCVSAFWLFITTFFLIIVFTITGIWAGDILEHYWGRDPSQVVVDEMVGVWIPLIAVCPVVYHGMVIRIDVWLALGAFVLFRVFDIFKPFGIRYAERWPGGLGIMLDDILAGVYSLIIILIVQWFI